MTTTETNSAQAADDEPIVAQTGDVTTIAGTRSGRGPTRSGVRFGDLLDDLAAMPQEDRDDLLDALRGGATAKSLQTLAKSLRKGLKDYVADKQAEIGAHEATAELLARVDALSPLHRAALIRTLEPDAPTA